MGPENLRKMRGGVPRSNKSKWTKRPCRQEMGGKKKGAGGNRRERNCKNKAKLKGGNKNRFWGVKQDGENKGDGGWEKKNVNVK